MIDDRQAVGRSRSASESMASVPVPDTPLRHDLLRECRKTVILRMGGPAEKIVTCLHLFVPAKIEDSRGHDAN